MMQKKISLDCKIFKNPGNLQSQILRILNEKP